MEVAELAVYLGEKKDSDPAAIFVLLHAFSKALDTTIVQVAKKTGRLEEPLGASE